MLRDRVNRLGQCLPLLDGRGHVEDNDLVDPFLVIPNRELSRIAGVAETFEIDPLDDAAISDVQAGDDSLRQHRLYRPASRGWSARPDARQKVPQNRQSDVSRFLGVKLHTGDVITFDDARKLDAIES